MADIQILSERLAVQYVHSDQEEREKEVANEQNEAEEEREGEEAPMTSSSFSTAGASDSPTDHTASMASNLDNCSDGDSESILNRQLVARSLLDTLRSVVHLQDDVASVAVFNVMLRLSEDNEPSVRAELVEQVPHLAIFCHEQSGKGLEEVLPRYMLPLVVRYLADPNIEVRKTSQSALLALLEQKLVQAGDLERQVWPMLSQLADLNNADHFRTEAVALMTRMATILGKDLAQQLFLERFVLLCDDSQFQIRKVCASHFGEFCTVMGKEVTEAILLPRFELLCNDGMWGVRKACADVFVAVACVCSLQTRRNCLTQLFIALLSDPTRCVLMAAFQALGPFISTFAENTHQLYYDQDGNVHVACPPESEDEDTTPERELPRPPEHIDTDKTDSKIEVLDDAEHEQGSRVQGGGDSGFGSRETSSVCSPAEEEEQEVELVDDAPTRHWGVLEMKENSCSASSWGSIEVDGEDAADAYNSFQFWREPVGDIDVELGGDDFDMEEEEEEQQQHHQLEEGGGRCRERCGTYRRHLQSNVLFQKNTSWWDTQRSVGSERTLLGAWGGGVGGLVATGIPTLLVESENVHPFAFDLQASSSSTFHRQGSLLAASMQTIVPTELLHQYIWMTKPTYLENMDSDVVRYCAHSLPAVTFTLGRKHWSLLRQLYETLASDVQWKVRRTLAFSIHELAAILGKSLTVSDLVPVFNSFIRDLDEVRIGILKHLAKFLALLPLGERSTFLPKIQEFLQPENERNWRFRLELTEQLVLLSSLYIEQEVVAYLLPVAVHLLQDRVAEVRGMAAETLAQLVQRLLGRLSDSDAEVDGVDEFFVPLARDLANFARHSKWNIRQTFANVCLRLQACLPPRLFAVHLLPALLELSTDSVANVRLVVAKALSNQVTASPSSSRSSSFRQEPPSLPSAKVSEATEVENVEEHGATEESAKEDMGTESQTEKEQEEDGERASVYRALDRLRNDRDRDVRQAVLVPSLGPTRAQLSPLLSSSSSHTSPSSSSLTPLPDAGEDPRECSVMQASEVSEDQVIENVLEEEPPV